MPSVAEGLRRHAAEFYRKAQQRGQAVGLQQRKVLSAITRCRTGQLGSLLYQCGSCSRRHWVGRSCGNRHCPNCQKQKTTCWLEKQTARLLPVAHFIVTFTVPSELRSLLRACKRDGYNAIFDAGAKTIRLLLANGRYLGSDCVGFFGALHTWGRDPMVYHPHVHFVVPCGGVSKDGSRWLSTPESFLFPHARAIALYKKCFAGELRKCGLYEKVPDDVWRGKWVVDVKPVGDGRAVLKYLAPYIHRVAISDNRIVQVNDDTVTYRFQPSGDKKWKTRKVDGWRFVGGFLQHVLPRGFQKIRYYGWMSPNCRMQLESVRWLVWLHRGWAYYLASSLALQEAIKPSSAKVRCSDCGHAMQLLAVVIPNSDDAAALTVRPRAPPQPQATAR